MTTNDTSPPDLDAIEARANEASAGPWAVDPCQGEAAVLAGGPVSLIVPWRRDKGALVDCTFIAHAREDVPALIARIRDLAAKLDASAQAFDALVADVWRATGETHEPPADVAALLRRVIDDHRALAGFRRAMLDVCERLDGVRPEPDFDAPAELGAWTCEEIGRRVASARREGAEAMREESAQAAARVANAWAQCECRCACGSSLAGLAAAEACTAEIRALPIVEAP